MSVAKHSVYNALGSLAPMLVGLVTVPIYLSQIGVERFGILALCWVLLGQLGFLNLGIGPALVQKLARSRRESAEHRSALFWTAVWLNLCMGLVGGLLLFGASPYYFDSVDLPKHIRHELEYAIPWLAGIVPLVMLSSVLNGALQGREEFLYQNIIGSVSSIVISVAPLVASFLIGPQLTVLLPAAMVGRALSVLLLVMACVRSVPVRGPRLDGRSIPQMLAFGGWITVVNLIAPLAVTIDRFLIGTLFGAAAVAVYVIPQNLVEKTKVVPQSIASALFPRFSYLGAEDRDRLFLDSVSAVAAVMTPVALFALMFIAPFMDIWIGREMASKSTPIALILMAGYWTNSFARVPWALLQAEGRPDLAAKLLLAYLVPYTMILYLCLTSFGVVGAAIAWSIKAFVDLISSFVLLKRAKAVLPRLMVPGLLVYGGLSVTLFLPVASAGRWLLLGILFIVGLYVAHRIAPESLRAHVRQVTRLRPVRAA